MNTVDFDGRIYFRLLAAVAAVDGHVSPEEVEKFRELLKLARADPAVAAPLVKEAEERRAQPLWFMDGVTVSEDFARICIRDALVLTCVDGWYSPSEQVLIRQAATIMGYPELLESLPESEEAQRLHEPPPLPEVTEEVLHGGLGGTDGRVFGGDDDFDGSFYFRMLAAVAAADGEIHEDETRRFAELIRLAGGNPQLAEHLSREAELRQREPLWFVDGAGDISPTFARLCLRDAGMIALADGQVAQAETDLLAEAALRLGVTDYAAPAAWGEAPSSASEAAASVQRSRDIQSVDRALAAASGAAVVAGGAYIVAGGTASKILAGLAAATGTGAVGLVVPMLAMLGAGVAGVALQIAKAFSDRGDD